jgi:hypothetical protein
MQLYYKNFERPEIMMIYRLIYRNPKLVHKKVFWRFTIGMGIKSRKLMNKLGLNFDLHSICHSYWAEAILSICTEGLYLTVLQKEFIMSQKLIMLV